MEFVLFVPQLRLRPREVIERAVAAEAAGFDGLALADHLAPPLAEDKPLLEAFGTATWIAAHTTTLRIGHLVLCDAFRHPALLAQQAVTLDHLSGGRFELGLGTGSRPEELRRFGIAHGDAATRARRLGETLAVVRDLWRGEPVTRDGEFFRLTEAQQALRPLSTIPIVLGGTSDAVLRLVREHGDWLNLPPRDLGRLEHARDRIGAARVSLLQMVALTSNTSERASAADLVRRRYPFLSSTAVIDDGDGLIEHFARLRDRGVGRAYVWFADFGPPSTLDAFGSRVIAQLPPGP